MVLITAGRDGLIDQHEWDVNLSKGLFFSDISWEYLNLADVDGDKRISINEFFKYYQERQTSFQMQNSANPKENELLFFDSKPSRPVYNDSFVPEMTDPESMNQRVLFKRAHIARLMKFSAMSDPEMAYQANKKRSDRLKNIRYRRRLALSKKPELTEEDRATMQSIFRSKLVTNRFSQSPAREVLSSSPTTMTNTPVASSADDVERSRYRNALNELKKKTSPENRPVRTALEQAMPSETLATEQQQEKPVRSRKVTDIRKLIPHKNSTIEDTESGSPKPTKPSKIRESLSTKKYNR